jgi:two-component system, LytTR family, sensor kinase
MKTACEGCGSALPPDCEAYNCSFECTFCPQCYSSKQKTCPNCGGELVRRPRRATTHPETTARPFASAREMPRIWLVFAISFGVWLFVALAATLTIWQLYRSTEVTMKFSTTFWVELSQILTYAPLTPFVYTLATLFPIRRNNWKQRAMVYLAAGMLFCICHIALRSLSPYAIYQPKTRDWTSAVWDSHTHHLSVQWDSLRRLFWNNIVDDITGTFVPIVLIAHALSYYRKFRDRELRATQLESQLVKAHLQSLKSQLQPHFLFNTMHSISALMLTDVPAADRMITRLADLLRMNLESAGTQITTLHRELEFVNCYLEIERVRFEERLTVVYAIAPETLDAQVPLLLLQPLIDNAVKHGISHMTSGGEVRISSLISNGDLKLEVRDNGPGFSMTGSKDRGCGLGLKVTRQRLEKLYGENQSLELASHPEGGVSVAVTIPLSVWQDDTEKAPASPNPELSFALQGRSA